MVARATAPNRIGPGNVFPDLATWDFSDGLKGSPMANAPFWLALVCQIIIVIGYFWFYRKEQLGTSHVSESPHTLLTSARLQPDHDQELAHYTIFLNSQRTVTCDHGSFSIRDTVRLWTLFLSYGLVFSLSLSSPTVLRMTRSLCLRYWYYN